MRIILLIHVMSAFISLSGFILRGVWMIRGSALLKARITRIAPHVNDTLLLAMGITLMVQTQQYPTTESWLAVKLLALLIYIGLGMVAFRFGRTLAQRTVAWLCAIIVFLYIIGVALSRNPLVFS